MPGEHSRRTGPATIRSAVYHRTRDSIEAHLTIVLAALAVSRWIEAATGWSIRRFVRTARRYRPAKILHSFGSLTVSWRRRAAVHVVEDGQVARAAGLARRNGLPLAGAADVGEEVLEGAVRAVVAAVAGRRAAYGRRDLLAEARRLLHGVRFA